MVKLGNITITRRKNYDELKLFLSNRILSYYDDRVPSVRELSIILGINKSSVSRALLQLCDDGHWIAKMDRGSSRNSYYKIIADKRQCEMFRNYYLLPTRKKRNFRVLCERAGQFLEVGQCASETKTESKYNSVYRLGGA